jgi:hypothetical protein
MTAFRAIAIWNGQKEDLFIQARFAHATGKIAFVFPLADGASSEIVAVDAAALNQLERYVVARGRAASVQQWPAANANLKNVARLVQKGDEAFKTLKDANLSAQAPEMDKEKTYAVAIYDVPENIAGTADELVTEVLHVALKSPRLYLPAACKGVVYLLGSASVNELQGGFTFAYREETPYFWGRRLDEGLSAVKDLFAREDAQFCLGAVTMPETKAPEMKQSATLKPADAALDETAAKILSAANGAEFETLARTLLDEPKLAKLAELLEARAAIARKLLFAQNPPSKAVRAFWEMIANADAFNDKTQAEKTVEALGGFFSPECWTKQMAPILKRMGPLDFVTEGRKNAMSYDTAVISEVIQHDTAKVIFQLRRKPAEGQPPAGNTAQQRYTLEYKNGKWLIVGVEDVP